ncbi:MAG: hypothetical protein ABI836_08455 [Gemmatimonadota bacterium]
MTRPSPIPATPADATTSRAPYQTALKAHLTRYKEERLGVRQSGTWSGNDKSYSHILPPALKRLNLLETIRREFAAYQERAEGGKLKLHRDFHHLTSSQAMAFNLFFPFVGGLAPDAGRLLELLGARGERIATSRFEAVPNLKEGTNFDLHLVLESGKQVFLEVKLSETEYGGASANAERKAKLDNHYAPRLRGKVADDCLESPLFFRHYQLLRNVSHLELERGDRLAVVRPRANEALRGSEQWLIAALQGECGGRVGFLDLEDLAVDLMRQRHLPPRVAAHYELFGEKYLIPEEPGR